MVPHRNLKCLPGHFKFCFTLWDSTDDTRQGCSSINRRCRQCNFVASIFLCNFFSSVSAKFLHLQYRIGERRPSPSLFATVLQNPCNGERWSSTDHRKRDSFVVVDTGQSKKMQRQTWLLDGTPEKLKLLEGSQ